MKSDYVRRHFGLSEGEKIRAAHLRQQIIVRYSIGTELTARTCLLRGWYGISSLPDVVVRGSQTRCRISPLHSAERVAFGLI
jgi:hypothetical protein